MRAAIHTRPNSHAFDRLPAETLRTTLYSKLFINGFAKPSYVVFSARTPARLEADALRTGLRRVLERHPMLRARVEMSWLGVPRRFKVAEVGEWWSGGGLTVMEDGTTPADLEVHLMRTPMDLARDFPFRVWIRRDASGAGSTLHAKLHHAVVDGHSGRQILMDLLGAGVQAARAPDAPGATQPVWRRAAQWLRGTRLGRLPQVSLLSRFTPEGPTDALVVEAAERLFPADWLARQRARARERGLTFPQALCVALLQSFDTCNRRLRAAHDGLALPKTLGLMVAVSQRRHRGERGPSQGFDAETRLVTVPGRLAEPDQGRSLADYVRRVLRERRVRHNHVSLAAMYVRRRASALWSATTAGAVAAPRGAVHLTYSDLTGLATRFDRPLQLDRGLRLEGPRILVTPVAADHTVLLVYCVPEGVRLSLTYHRGALDGSALLDDVLAHLAPAATD